MHMFLVFLRDFPFYRVLFFVDTTMTDDFGVSCAEG